MATRNQEEINIAKQEPAIEIMQPQRQTPIGKPHIGGYHGRGGRFGGVGRQIKIERDGIDERTMRGGRLLSQKNGDGIHRSVEDRINERLSAINGPMFDLPSLNMEERKFAGRNRLYIGNLAPDVSEEEVQEMFKPYGEIGELFINKEKNFGFIRLDYYTNAQKAKCELDGMVRKGRTLKIRFAPNGATVKVKNLTPWVTNELLQIAFSVFGEVERCVVIVDDRGKPTGEGIVEFTRKPSAISAIKYCTEGCFFLTSSLKPVIAESYEQVDMVDGHPEKSLLKKTMEYHEAREVGPRFAAPGSFEHEYGSRWKQLHSLYKQKEIALKQELTMEEDKLEAQMQYAKAESETEMLREQLRMREMDRERQKREWEERERQAEEQRVRNEEHMRRQQEEMQMRMHSQEEDLRRRQQENNLFMQAHQLTNMLDQQEQVIQSYDCVENKRPDYEPTGSGAPSGQMDPKSFMNSYERSHRYEGRGMGEMGTGMPARGGNMGNRSHWGNENHRDDFQNKRRRY